MVSLLGLTIKITGAKDHGVDYQVKLNNAIIHMWAPSRFLKEGSCPGGRLSSTWLWSRCFGKIGTIKQRKHLLKIQPKKPLSKKGGVIIVILAPSQSKSNEGGGWRAGAEQHPLRIEASPDGRHDWPDDRRLLIDHRALQPQNYYFDQQLIQY